MGRHWRRPSQLHPGSPVSQNGIRAWGRLRSARLARAIWLPRRRTAVLVRFIMWGSRLAIVVVALIAVPVDARPIPPICKDLCRPAIRECVQSVRSVNRRAWCRRQLLRKCRRSGLEVCGVTTTTTTTTIPCSSPCATGGCCPPDFPVCTHDGSCCRAGSVVCDDEDGDGKRFCCDDPLYPFCDALTYPDGRRVEGCSGTLKFGDIFDRPR